LSVVGTFVVCSIAPARGHRSLLSFGLGGTSTPVTLRAPMIL
jgi:hypothetical protein